MKFREDHLFRSAFFAREPQAVNAFVGHFVTVLTRQGQVLGLTREEAEDAVQEAFSVLFRKLNELQTEVRLSTFLYGIFLNTVREVRRKRGKVEAQGDLSGVEHLISQQYDEKGHWKTGVFPLPLEKVLSSESSQELERCLEQLPERHRGAVLLTLQEDGDPHELCHTLGVSYVNFRQMLTRARQALRLCLENYVRDPS